MINSFFLQKRLSPVLSMGVSVVGLGRWKGYPRTSITDFLTLLVAKNNQMAPGSTALRLEIHNSSPGISWMWEPMCVGERKCVSADFGFVYKWLFGPCLWHFDENLCFSAARLFKLGAPSRCSREERLPLKTTFDWKLKYFQLLGLVLKVVITFFPDPA